MLQIPSALNFGFIATTLVFYVLFLFSMLSGSERVQRRVHMIALVLLAWIIFQSTLALNGWYMNRTATPPHMIFPVIVTFSLMTLAFATPRGRRFIGGLSPFALTLLHVIRIPVEICLYWLAYYKQVPWSMTFYGHNYDIVFGITAPIIAWFGIRKRRIPTRLIQAWNVAGIISLLIIIVTAFGAAPSPLQSWDFQQPNYAVLHFPFIWLPSVIVPLVLFAHIAILTHSSFSFAKREDGGTEHQKN